MADSLSERTPAPETLVVPKRKGPLPLRAYEGRFNVAYIALALIVSAAVVAFAVVLKRPGSASSVRWSSWKPTDSGLNGARQIAEHVAPRYRLAGNQQVAAVVVAPLQAQNYPISYVAVRNGGSTQDDQLIPAAKTVPYTLCGLGSSCAILTGAASPARARLVKREAIELALYTFRYIDSADAVLAYLPPPKGQQLNATILFRRDDFHDALAQPLRATLPAKQPLTTASISGEAGTIAAITNDRTFRWNFQQLPDASAIVVLTPPGL